MFSSPNGPLLLQDPLEAVLMVPFLNTTVLNHIMKQEKGDSIPHHFISRFHQLIFNFTSSLNRFFSAHFRASLPLSTFFLPKSPFFILLSYLSLFPSNEQITISCFLCCA